MRFQSLQIDHNSQILDYRVEAIDEVRLGQDQEMQYLYFLLFQTNLIYNNGNMWELLSASINICCDINGGKS